MCQYSPFPLELRFSFYLRISHLLQLALITQFLMVKFHILAQPLIKHTVNIKLLVGKKR